MPQGLDQESDVVVLCGCKDGSRVLQAWQSVADSRRPGDSPAFAFPGSGCDWNRLLPGPTERLREPRQNRQVGVKLDAFQATDAARGKSVVVLQVSELALHGDTAAVEIVEPLGIAPDARQEATADADGTRRRAWTARGDTPCQRA